jgi:hypothetical protein
MNNIYTFSGNIHLPDPNCPIYWMGSSKKDLMALPLEVRKFFGHALDFAQRGEQHDAAKILKGFGGAGVLEIVKEDRTIEYVCYDNVENKPELFRGTPAQFVEKYEKVEA